MRGCARSLVDRRRQRSPGHGRPAGRADGAGSDAVEWYPDAASTAGRVEVTTSFSDALD